MKSGTQKLKKFLAFVMTVVMVLTAVPLGGLTFSASAENEGYYTYTVENGEATITGCDKSISGDVVIPSTLGGYPVTSIGYEAFRNCTGLTSITIPDSVTSIGDYAFSNCTGLTGITIPDSVTSIGYSAFYGCTGLASITIPDSVTSIGNGAYYDTAYYDNDSNWEDNVLYIGNHLIKAKDSISGAYSIKGGTKTIADGAFSYCTGLTSVTIPDSVTSIGDSAFSFCARLTSITIPDGVTSIGDCAFDNCTGLTSITIPDSVTSIGYEAFYNCAGLTGITIPDGVTSIGVAAFSYCTGLTSIIVSSGNTVYHSTDNCLIETESKTLISGCKNSIIPSDGSVTSIGDYAFWYCSGLTSITIPDSVTSIGDGAFEGCTGLTSITIPDSVTSIGDNAYYDTAYYNNNSNWENDVLYIGNHLIKAKDSISGVYDIKDGTKTIADYAFYDCIGLTSITISDGVTSIGNYAFCGCTGLTSITIPDSVTSIGEEAFANCTGLTSINIPDSVTSIGDDAFANCTGLTSINIPDSVTSIGDDAFGGCTGLTSVTIGNSVTSIGVAAFYCCESLTSITVSSGNKVYHSTDNCLIETESKTLIFGCKNSIIPSDGSVTSIGAGAFGGCTGLTSVTIPNSVTSIYIAAFAYCTGLTSITIPDGVTSIGEIAFCNCTGLTSITIPDGVTSIGEIAFYNCTGLTSVTIGNSVTSIGEEAFANCTGLTSITIPSSVTDIGYEAFGYYYDESTNEYKKLDNFTIYGCPGTAAETYANENGFAFIALDEEHTHTYSDWVVTTEPTCTAEGEETRTCSVCGATETRPVEKKAHDLFRVEEASTCKVQGVSYDVCDSCGNTFNYTVLPLAPHTFGEWAVTTEPTCTAEGEETRTCSVCGATETRPVEKKAHDLFHVEEASTCTVAGVSYDVCDSCGNTFNYTVLPLAPHTFGEWVTTKEATVFESGERKRTCTVCGFEETEEIERLNVAEVKDEKTGISVVYPENSYEGEVEISVTQTFDGASYHVLNAEKGNYQKALFDITTLVDGNKVQPNGSVFVKIPLPDGYNAEKTVVYYITNDGRLEKMDSRVEDGYIVFETTHFSFYAIVDETEKQPENPSENCSCACHKKGIAKLFFKIKLFFQKIFKKNKVCKCGVNHY